jgi:glycerophosphoryl diester phosphodiesterase
MGLTQDGQRVVAGFVAGSLRPNQIEPAPLQRPLAYVVDLVHESGREFLAWCPTRTFARRLIEAGVAALCVSNVPKLLSSLAQQKTA